MKGLFNRQFDALLRVSAFGEKHSDLFPPSSLSGQLFRSVAEAIPELRKNDGSQAAGFAYRREGVAAKIHAKKALRERMYDITRTARSIGREQPGVQAKFRWPRDGSDKGLLAAARGFVANAAPLAAMFVAHEMTPNFVDELKAAIDRLERAIEDCAEKKGNQVAATASIETAMVKAIDAVLRLDGIVPNKIKSDPALFREWQAARRIASARGSRGSDAPPTPPTPAAAA